MERIDSNSYNSRFYGEDLAQFHHAYEHTRACAMLDSLCPLDSPCLYKYCGSKATFRQFATCNETFTTAKERGEHMRSHMSIMTKKDANDVKVPTCFSGDCALNPEQGRLNRKGPDFAGEEEQLAHLWSTHHVTTLETAGIACCGYCSTWMLESHEWCTHAIRHLTDAQSITTEFGFCGVQAGREVFPRLWSVRFLPGDSSRP
jgi:hypothetical protein